jgi:hypothetical protein
MFDMTCTTALPAYFKRSTTAVSCQEGPQRPSALLAAGSSIVQRADGCLVLGHEITYAVEAR